MMEPAVGMPVQGTKNKVLWQSHAFRTKSWHGHAFGINCQLCFSGY
jgi:hypothetical protein